MSAEPNTVAHAPEGSRRREDRCPGVLALHRAPDGWLARVRLPGGRLTCAQLRHLAGAASALGSGLVQLTARANLQIRGLSETAGEDLAARLAAAGLLPSRAHERVRNVLASPLAGRHPQALADVDELVWALDRRLCADPLLAALPRRFLFLVEDGSGTLDGHDHDVALVAAPAGGATIVLALLVGGQYSGRRVPIVAGAASDAAELALAAARLFLARRTSAWRVRELRGGPQAVIEGLESPSLPPNVRPPGTRPAGPILRWGARHPGHGHASGRPVPLGPIRQRDGRVAVTALVPHGRLRSAQLLALAAIGAEVRVSPWRTLSLVDLADDGPARELAGLGLVLDADREPAP